MQEERYNIYIYVKTEISSLIYTLVVNILLQKIIMIINSTHEDQDLETILVDIDLLFKIKKYA